MCVDMRGTRDDFQGSEVGGEGAGNLGHLGVVGDTGRCKSVVVSIKERALTEGLVQNKTRRPIYFINVSELTYSHRTS